MSLDNQRNKYSWKHLRKKTKREIIREEDGGKKQTIIGGNRRNVNAGGEPNHLSLSSFSVSFLSLFRA